MKVLEKTHRGLTPFLLSIVTLFGLGFFFDTNMQWELKVLHSAAEALIGVYLFYWATRWLIVKRVHELAGNDQRIRELVLIAGAAIVVAGALSG